MSIISKLLEVIDDKKDRLVKLASDLVKFNTIAGAEAECQEYISATLKSLEFDKIDVWEPNNEELAKTFDDYVTCRDNFKGSPNVVGILKGSGGGRSLIYNVHVDVVPEGDWSDWTYPPFDGCVENGSVYGRGISDMKGANAPFWIAIEAIRSLGLKIKGDIIYQSVVEEERGGAGTLACALRGYKADAAIIPEPTDFRVCVVQQGSMWYRIKINGKAAHGATRYQGISALDKAFSIAKCLESLEKRRNEIYASQFYGDIPIPFTINVGKMNAGDFPSTVPAKSYMEGRIGIAPGEEIRDARRMVEGWIKESCSQDEWLKEHNPLIEWFGAVWGSAKIDPAHPIVEVCREAYNDVTGLDAKLAGTQWGTDAKALTDYSNTPTVVFGPGAMAHCADERVEIDKLVNYSKIIAIIILNWCEYS